MTEGRRKTPAEQVLDVFVYAPIGLLFDGATVLPQLVARGRSHVSLARVMGKYAVRQGRTEATRAAERLQGHASGVLGLISESAVAPPSSSRPTSQPAARGPRPATNEVSAIRPEAPADLGIPDYDGLSASQVVNRLAGLSPTELTSVQRYEAAHRGRKTILSKVAQLQSS